MKQEWMWIHSKIASMWTNIKFWPRISLEWPRIDLEWPSIIQPIIGNSLTRKFENVIWQNKTKYLPSISQALHSQSIGNPLPKKFENVVWPNQVWFPIKTSNTSTLKSDFKDLEFHSRSKSFETIPSIVRKFWVKRMKHVQKLGNNKKSKFS